jgi:LmbE family N-acetylglucosaminyl deacetylase
MTGVRERVSQGVRWRLRSLGWRAESLVQRQWRRGLVAASRDRTAESTRRSCLVIAAHPDDETFGCGAIIARKRNVDTPVKVFIACDGRNANPTSKLLTPEELGALRRQEAVDACGVLGVSSEFVIQLAIAHLRSDAAVALVTQRLADVIDEFAPAEILVNTALDYHPDHKILNGIVRQLAVDKQYGGWLAEYPVWYLFDGPWEPGSKSLAGRPTMEPRDPYGRGLLRQIAYRLIEPIASVLRLRLSKVSAGTFVETKRRAVDIYRTQVTNFTGEDVWGFLPPRFVNLFLGDEILFEIEPAQAREGQGEAVRIPIPPDENSLPQT